MRKQTEFHVVQGHEVIRSSNGSALVTIARELSQAAIDAGADAYVVSGRGLAHEADNVQAILDPSPTGLGRGEILRRAATGRAQIFSDRLATPSVQPDILYLHNRPWDAPLFRAAFPNATIILYLHNRVLRRVPRWAKRRTLAAFDGIIFVSDFLRRDLEKRSGSLPVRSLVALPAVPTTFRSPPDGADATPIRPVDVLFVGRLTPEKGAHVLLSALAEDKNLNTTARVIGGRWFHPLERKTRYERRIQRVAARMGERIEVMGPLAPDVVDAHRASARVTVVPSVWPEPLGLTVLEAMASPSATIASRTGGIPELDSAGGVVLVQPGSVSQLRDAISHLLEDESARGAVVRAGTLSASAMSWASTYQSIAGFMAKLPADARDY